MLRVSTGQWVVAAFAALALLFILGRMNWGDAFDGRFEWRALVRPVAFVERLDELICRAVRGAEPRRPGSERVEALFSQAEHLDARRLELAHEHAANILGNPLVEDRLLRALPPILEAAVRRGRAGELAWIRERAVSDAGGDERMALALTLAGWAALLHDDLAPDDRALLGA